MSPRPRSSVAPPFPFGTPAGEALTVETIADAYLADAGHDPLLAIRRVIADALVDLCEAERRSLRRDRLISRGYVRGRVDGGEA